MQHLNNMKKKVLIIGSVVVAIIILVIVLLLSNRITYTIKISLVDDYSPDRILTVYNDKNEKIDVKRIEYLDGTLLCNGYNMVVHFGDIKDEKKFKVILKDKTVVMAKIAEEEVK